MREAVELANGQIYSYAREHPEVRGMGTTVTAAGIFGGDLYLTQIGDSRAYLVRGTDAVQLTKDQSLMQRLVDAGELTQDEAEQSERRNIILQALGPDPRVKVDLTHQPIRRGDTLILCSDGLSGVVRREEFAKLAREHEDLPALCSALIDLANARGGPDNITVVAAHFEGEGLEEANGSDGVGHQRYHLSQITTPPEPAVPSPADSGDVMLPRASLSPPAPRAPHPTEPHTHRGAHSGHDGRAPAAARRVAVALPQSTAGQEETAGVDAPLRARLTWLAALSFASGFPFGLVNETLPVYLRTHGAGLVEIGLISALSFPWTFKFVWAPLVDRLGSRRQWIVGCLAGLTLLTLILGHH